MSVFISSGPFKNIQNQELVVTTDLILRHGTLQTEVISPYHMQRTSLVTKTNPAESPLWRLSIQQTKTKKRKKKKSKILLESSTWTNHAKEGPESLNLGMFTYRIMLKYHANKLTKLTRQEGFL